MKLFLAATTLPAIVAGYSMGGYGRFGSGRPVIMTPGGPVCSPGPCSPKQAQQFRQQQKEFVDRAFEDLQDEMTKSGRARDRGDVENQKEGIRQQQEWVNRAFGLASDVASAFASSPSDVKEANEALRQQKEWVNRAFGMATDVTSGFSSPRYQVKDNDEAFQVELDVPGVKVSDIDISVDEDGQVLTVRGERDTNKFSRSFDLDPTSDTDKITAALNNGVLKVTIPKERKKVEEKVKKIPVMQVTDDEPVPSMEIDTKERAEKEGDEAISNSDESA